ncbi:MAG: S9 family peptidase [Gemmatimonadaceae bacterium]|nr:S9 family peptidase [Gemmatimonadaceae bacterium]
MMLTKKLFLAASLLVTPVALVAQTQRAITIQDFEAVKAIGDPQLSPDGKWVLYSVRSTDMAANKRKSVTVMQPVAGGTVKQFPDANTAVTEARWSPDGKWIAYTSGGQLWVADVAGGNKKQLTSLSDGASGPVWAASGDKIALVSGVYPDCATDACNVARSKAADTMKVHAHIADNLMYRHWNAWTAETHAHLFVVAPDGSGLRDVTPRANYDVPPGPFGGSEGYSFSPDGKEIAFTAKDQGREDAWSTDINIYTLKLDGSSSPVAITSANKGADQNPVYSPDGRTILYGSQETPGYESDRVRLMAYDRSTGQSRELLPKWDRNSDSYAFSPNGSTIYIGSVDASHTKIFRLMRSPAGWTMPAPETLVSAGNNTALSVSLDGKTISWLQESASHPSDVYVATVGPRGITGTRRLTHDNDALLAQLKVNPIEEFWFKGANGDSVQGFVIKPPQYEAGKKFPVIFLIHGGPQGEWADQWHSRWNYQMFAAPGFGIVAINPRGSIGYGAKFTRGISMDWGGKVFVDLEKGLNAALANNAWLDSTRVGAAGGSFGGYAVNWIAGHPMANRFKALFTHDGVFNLENMYGATEEIWFTDFEYGGPYWDPKLMESQYRKFSPHLFAGNFHVPHLVVHGDLDYRIPSSEAMSLFTALQRQGVPSRLIIFPDEGHWVLKPQNQQLWWGQVQGWFSKYLQ